jgi:hypothetical protein
MQVDQKILESWLELKESGDVKAIAKLLSVTTVRASQIINSGNGSLTQISCVQKFYKNRKKEVSKINDDNN